MTTPHTPLPWIAAPKGRDFGSDIYYIVKLPTEQDGNAIIIAQDLSRADAELIINAIKQYYPHLAEIDMLKERVAELELQLKNEKING